METGTKLVISTDTNKILENRELTTSAFVLRFERKNIQFTSGQHIALSTVDSIENREYSIYSGENDNYLEVLIKEVKDGVMSKKFRALKPGNVIKVIPPVGYFTIRPEDIKTKKFVFIGSGTGIAPYHSYVSTYPSLDYTVLHGIKTLDEAYEREHYKKGKYIACTSRDEKGDFNGRVTDYLRAHKIDPNALYYLCGNYDMIDEVYSILQDAAVPVSNIHSEVYF